MRYVEWQKCYTHFNLLGIAEVLYTVQYNLLGIVECSIRYNLSETVDMFLSMQPTRNSKNVLIDITYSEQQKYATRYKLFGIAHFYLVQLAIPSSTRYKNTTKGFRNSARGNPEVEPVLQGKFSTRISYNRLPKPTSVFWVGPSKETKKRK